MSIFIAAAGISAALFVFKATRTIGAVGLLLVSYFFPIIDLALASILLAGIFCYSSKSPSLSGCPFKKGWKIKKHAFDFNGFPLFEGEARSAGGFALMLEVSGLFLLRTCGRRI